MNGRAIRVGQIKRKRRNRDGNSKAEQNDRDDFHAVNLAAVWRGPLST
jgi:hypothetical protein